MKKIFLEYSNILGMTFTGLVFGLSFFLLLINLYHYKEVNTVYKRETDEVELYQTILKEIDEIDYNLEKYDINKYVGSNDKASLLLVKSKIKVCANELNNKKITNILDKSELSMRDIYNLEKNYNEYVINNCLAKQLNDFSNNNLKIDSLQILTPFLKNQTSILIDYTDYSKIILESNSNYFFESTASKESIGDIKKESFYKILVAYKKTTDYVLELSRLYDNIVGGKN